ncbi:hypothetical protein ACQWU4_09810 [Chryseobacterium sp. MIQD13]|uniref:hypothetical protein n=1 Tax=Chryseobacterium sp. MIQD13 TaxID=3422310 RepID=UPI003D2DE1A5
MRKIILALLSIFVISCVPKFEPNKKEDRLYFKEIKSGNMLLQWFYYSSAVSESPEYIVLNKNNKEDTIVVSTNIADINLDRDSMKISFYGKPTRYNESTKVTLKNYPIKLDTTVVSDGPKYRKTYKKPDR